MPDVISPEWLAEQVAAYRQVYPLYLACAQALERVFKQACDGAVPERIVQARPKSVSSFAEKCVRKHDKYPNPVEDMTDLCGGRIIVQTPAQVEAVKKFIECNFEVVERDDKASLLGEDKFGYRDMHFLVRLLPARARLIGFTNKEIKAIGERIAEVQVRSVAQHAWADTLHDRIYKTPLKLSQEAKRTTALLAAVMEDGDRAFDRLTGEIDGMVANYSAYASREVVENEIGIQRLIFKNERDPGRRARMATHLARLLIPCGEYREAVRLLSPFSKTRDPVREELLLELGHALCRLHRERPGSAEFKAGQSHLQKVAAICSDVNYTAVPNLSRRSSLLARACSRLARSWTYVRNSEINAREYYRRALETEPSNPYHLANHLGFEIYCTNQDGMLSSMGTIIRQGIATCRQHALAGTELPYALFTAARLCLLLGDGPAALGWYARGLRHLFDGQSCVPGDVLEDELQWVENIHFGEKPARELLWFRRLIALVCAFKSKSGNAGDETRVLIVAGGAASMGAGQLDKIRPLLADALTQFRGSVISGGTKSGIPGCVGEIAAELRRRKRKQFELTGYVPRRLPGNAPRDDRYDRIIEDQDEDFSPGQILRMWEDLLHQGISPGRVTVLGFGGGPMTAVEYRIAFALGANVAVAGGSGGASDEIVADPVWTTAPSIIVLPFDAASIKALATRPETLHREETLGRMGEAFHEKYLKENARKLPGNQRPWNALPETYRTANIEQARYAVEILRATGFGVRVARGKPAVFTGFRKAEIEKMAELEHGRWNVERLRDGWRPGRPRDDAKKIHDCLVSWKELPESIREYDRKSVKAYPEILALAGMEVFRK